MLIILFYYLIQIPFSYSKETNNSNNSSLIIYNVKSDDLIHRKLLLENEENQKMHSDKDLNFTDNHHIPPQNGMKRKDREILKKSTVRYKVRRLVSLI